MHLPRRISALVAHPAAPYAFALAMQLLFVGYVKDDAYIEYRYATNAAHGHGLVFNIGDPPVEGFTSFLWTVLCIVPALLRVPLLAFGKLAGAASLVGCIAVTAALVRARGGDERAQQLARWLVATNASLLVWAQSGMEPVQTALAVTGVRLFSAGAAALAGAAFGGGGGGDAARVSRRALRRGGGRRVAARAAAGDRGHRARRRHSSMALALLRRPGAQYGARQRRTAGHGRGAASSRRARHHLLRRHLHLAHVRRGGAQARRRRALVGGRGRGLSRRTWCASAATRCSSCGCSCRCGR